MRRLLVTGVCIVAVLAATLAPAAEEGPFAVRILAYPEKVPLGVARANALQPPDLPGGLVEFQILAEVKNVSGREVPGITAGLMGYPYGPGLAIYAIVQTETGNVVRPCRPMVFVDDLITAIGAFPADWKKQLDLPACVPGPGKYSVRVVAEQHSPLRDSKGRSYKVWDGVVSSKEVTVVVTEPTGADKQAYEAFGHEPLRNSERYGELLARFPESTYAAYVVWKRFVKRWAAVDPDQAVGLSGRDFAFETGLMPCDRSARPTGKPETRLSGLCHVECRDKWLDIVLTNHPHIWFADEIRLRIALDRYLLGDKDGCAAGLEDLAEHGKPYVASKAGELLAAMRAKGMLEEGSE